jgi:rhodanese-related sulfurtransferase
MVRPNMRLYVTVCLWSLAHFLAMFGRADAFAAVPMMPGTAAKEPVLRDRAGGGPLCGIHSLWACLRSQEIQFRPEDTLTSEYVGSHQGSTGIELLKAAQACGASAQGFIQLTADDLKLATCPMILHMRGTAPDHGYHHWVAFLGIDGNHARILDAPHSVELMSFAELMANWDGMGIAISSKPIDRVLLDEARVYYGMCAIAFVATLFLLRHCLDHERFVVVRQRLSKRRIVAIQCVVLFTIASCAGVAQHALGESGFLRNPHAVAEVTRRYYSLDIKERPLEELSTLLEHKTIVLIDARRTVDFRRGAIPGAISMPVDSSLLERQTALRGVPKTAQLVVYCQSAGCKYADEVAGFLRFNDYHDVSIYRGGFQEWSKSNWPQKTATSLH